MTKSLIKKEFSLLAHPMTYIFAFFGIMLLIPSYPYYVAFFYVTLGIFFAFMNGRENKDLYFNAILPVSKKDTVRAKLMFVWIIELFSIIFSVPFAVITQRINPNGSNLAGIEANPAFFGLVFIMFTLFNAVFLIKFFKTAYKVGIAFLVASVAVSVYVVIAESLDRFPVVGDYLEGFGVNGHLNQLPVLIVGIAVFFISFVPINKQCAKNFEKVDL